MFVDKQNTYQRTYYKKTLVYEGKFPEAFSSTYVLTLNFIEGEMSESILGKILHLNFIDITNLNISDNKFRSNSFLRISRIQLLSANVGNMYDLK